jgi:RimJ/RimL family protein N-acetyltransferase
MNIEIIAATSEDCEFIHVCRNHPMARAASRSREEIPYEQHQRWFAEAMLDPKKYLYIALDQDVKVGSLRFDEVTEGKAEVNISLNPEIYGKSYGAEVIREGSLKFLEDSSQTRIVRAEIFSDSIASIRAFEKAGYAKKGRTKEGLLEYHFSHL